MKLRIKLKLSSKSTQTQTLKILNFSENTTNFRAVLIKNYWVSAHEPFKKHIDPCVLPNFAFDEILTCVQIPQVRVNQS